MFPSRFALALLAALLPGLVYGQAPTPAPVVDPISKAKAVLVAPPTFVPGFPVALDAANSIGDAFEWKITDKEQTLFIGDGRKLALTWKRIGSPNASQPFAIELLVYTKGINPKTGETIVTSVDSDIAIIVLDGTVPIPTPGPSPPPPPAPPSPPAPVPDDPPGPGPPDDATKISKACFVLIDSWQGRAKSPDLLSLGPENAAWQAIRTAGHSVINFDSESGTTKKLYASYIPKAPVVLIFDASKVPTRFVKDVPVKSIADVRKAVKDATGKDVP
jgi:hypothetical protein